MIDNIQYIVDKFKQAMQHSHNNIPHMKTLSLSGWDTKIEYILDVYVWAQRKL